MSARCRLPVSTQLRMLRSAPLLAAGLPATVAANDHGAKSPQLCVPRHLHGHILKRSWGRVTCMEIYGNPWKPQKSSECPCSPELRSAQVLTRPDKTRPRFHKPATRRMLSMTDCTRTYLI